MKLKTLPLSLAVTGLMALSLSGCGGGDSAATTPTKTPITITGTAATGAAFTGGTVYVYDSRGVVVGNTSTIDPTTGQYNLTLADGAVAPFVLVASRTNTDGQIETLVSVMASTDQTTANITPITSLIASQLSPSGDPTKLVDELAAGSATVSSTSIATAVTEINTILAPLLTATGTSSSDPLTSTFTTDGTSYDRLLDSISVSFTPTSSTSTNVDIGVKTALSDTSTPLSVSYTNATVPTTSPLPTIDSSALVASGTGAQIQDLLSRLTSCYAVPLTSRVTGTTASTISADVCKGIFLNSDPTLYKHNSYTVGLGAFNSMFTASASAAVKFDRPRYEYTVNNGNTTVSTKPMNGDVVFTASWSDVDGNSDSGEYWARPDSNGKLFLTGNLSGIDAEVSARVERREFLHANLASYSYLNTGFNLFINSKHTQLKDANGNPITVSKIVAVSPKGNQLTLMSPNNYGYYELMIPGTNTSSNTSVVRLAGKYTSSSATGSPRDVDQKLFWAKSCTDPADTTTCTNTDWSDTTIGSIPAQGNWTFNAYDANGGLITTFRRRTTNRPLTMAEASNVVWPGLTANTRTDIVNNSTAGYFTDTVDFYGELGGASTPAWEVPAGAAWLPTKLTVYGKDPLNGKSFDDAAKFRSNARYAKVTCSDVDGSGTADQHCVGDKFKAGVRINQLQFNGRDANRLNYGISYRLQNAW